MEKQLTYLDTYILQKDMRVRLPKSILANLELTKGESKFDIYYNSETKEIVLRVSDEASRNE